MSEATHFYQHELDALMVLLAFYFFSVKKPRELSSSAVLGGASLGVAILARPDAVPAAVIIWLYGAAVAWKLIRELPDRTSRMIRRTILAAAGPIGAIAGSMYFNYLRFGSVTQFGYWEDRARFVLDVPQIAKAIAGYLFSPALSVFVFAPPLILILMVGRNAWRRWPLETSTLTLAAVAHLLMIASNKTWSGDLSYGPRYMLESIVLLMPLTLPAFEMAVDRAPRRAAIAVAAIMFIGFIVQLIGVSVYVGAIEPKRIAAGIVANNAWVFVPSASPIVHDLEDLVNRRYLSPWALRALALPDLALLLLIALVAIVVCGGWLIFQYFRAPDAEPTNVGARALPLTILASAVVPILVGFAIARPLTQAPSVHGSELLNAGLAEQRAGHAVTAEEDYAMVLTLYPTNKFAWFDMAVLQQDAGHVDEAISLYQSVLRDDANFSPAKDNLEYIMRTHFGFTGLHPH